MNDMTEKGDQELDRPTPPSFTKLLLELALCIVIPVLILRNFSAEDSLGPSKALIVALFFPLCAGLYDLYKERKFSLVPTIGFISILLTGGIGVLKLPKEYIAIKEALVPLGFGLAVVFSIIVKKPFIRSLLFTNVLFDVNKISSKVEENNKVDELERTMIDATWILAASFLLSSVLNYALAKWIIVSETGTEAFNKEFGTMTALSYPVIALPTMLVTLYAMYFVISRIKRITGFEFEELFHEDLVAETEESDSKTEA